MIKTIIRGLILLLCCQSALADAFPVDIKQGNRKIEQAYKRLEQKNITVNQLNNDIDDIERRNELAQQCISSTENQLQIIQDFFSEKYADTNMVDQVKDIKYLENKRFSYIKQLSECRIFVFRSEEVLSLLKQRLQELSVSKTFERTTPLWELQFIKPDVFSSFKTDQLYQDSGLEYLTSGNLIIYAIILMISLSMALFFKKIFKRLLFRQDIKAHPLYFSAISVIRKWIIPVILLTVSAIFFSSVFYDVATTPLIQQITLGLLTFSFCMLVAKFLFFPGSNIDNPLHLNHIVSKRVWHSISLLLVFLLSGFIIGSMFYSQNIPKQTIDIARTLFITGISLSIMWMTWWLMKIRAIKRISYALVATTRLAVILILLVVIVLEWVGYHELSLLTIQSTLLTIISFVFVWVSIGITEWFIDLFDESQSELAKKIHLTLGLKPHRKMPEMILFRLVAYFIIAYVFILYQLSIWDFIVLYRDAMIKGFFEGFKFAGITVTPSNIILAIMVFITIQIVGRALSTYVARQYHLSAEKDSQVALSSIVSYIAFSLALVIALVVAGIDFTGIAIIAGALSVGIGLGLQNIVNNFVSGLILLIEKPIKPGDRILIGETEGYVKKVRIRSTQITTLSKEDVIVPNSDLITHQVTNYMFRDRLWRVTCKVGVAYESDIEKVKSVLLDVASQHPDVLNEPPNEPRVLFREFADSTLNFELWSIVRNVNRKNRIQSELNFAIHTAFAENNITIAFPQRDIHIIKRDD